MSHRRYGEVQASLEGICLRTIGIEGGEMSGGRGGGKKILRWKEKAKTYNNLCSLVVTDPTTLRSICSLSLRDRTGSRVFCNLWSYVAVKLQNTIYISRMQFTSWLPFRHAVPFLLLVVCPPPRLRGPQLNLTLSNCVWCRNSTCERSLITTSYHLGPAGSPYPQLPPSSGSRQRLIKRLDANPPDSPEAPGSGRSAAARVRASHRDIVPNTRHDPPVSLLLCLIQRG